jgi:hypothetical protein
VIPPKIPGTAEVLDHFVGLHPFSDVLDLGSGVGHLWSHLEGKRVVAVDLTPPEQVLLRPWVQYVQADLMGWTTAWRPQAMICSHVVEHMQDTRAFLLKMFSFLDEGRPWCLMWPPPQPGIRSEHVHHFPMGLMLYNLVSAGIDCRSVRMVRKNYTLGIIGLKKQAHPPANNDLEIVGSMFPFQAKHNFPGDNPPGIVDL